MFDAGLICESQDGLHSSLIEIEHRDSGRAEVQNLADLQVRDAHANCIAITDESEALAVGPIGNDFALQDHIASLHVNLIKFAKGPGSILDDIGHRVHCLP